MKTVCEVKNGVTKQKSVSAGEKKNNNHNKDEKNHNKEKATHTQSQLDQLRG